ncbi:MAG: TMEM175 family protein [Ferruginibacter sp.]
MSKGRLEAFSDGVLAIIITIMVLEIKVPHGNTLLSLQPLLPVFLSYLLSFINIGIYWNNHHHMFLLVKNINGKVLWCNIHLLFWLSLIPFATGWMGENNFTLWPVVIYGIVLLFCGVAYSLLVVSLLKTHGKNSTFAEAIGRDKKGKISIAIYALGILLSFVNSWIGLLLYIIVAFIWFIPDRRIENKIIP